jgi:hypothetical protein
MRVDSLSRKSFKQANPDIFRSAMLENRSLLGSNEYHLCLPVGFEARRECIRPEHSHLPLDPAMLTEMDSECRFKTAIVTTDSIKHIIPIE